MGLRDALCRKRGHELFWLLGNDRVEAAVTPAWLLKRHIRKDLLKLLLPEIEDRVRVTKQQFATWERDSLEAIAEQQKRHEVEVSRAFATVEGEGLHLSSKRRSRIF